MTRLEALLQRASGASVELPEAAPEITKTPMLGSGSMTTKVIVLGESPDYDDYENGTYFNGRNSKRIRKHMWLAGLRPDHCRFEYIYPHYPVPGGSLDKLDPTVLHQYQADTLERISQCSQPRVIVCVGNVALETLTNYRDISRRRGSVYEWRGKKVVGIVHPGIIRKRPAFEKCSRLDWERIAKLSYEHTTHYDGCDCAIAPKREIVTTYSDKNTLLETCETFLAQAQKTQEIMAIDVETPKIDGKRQLYCVSFAFDKHKALVLPFNQGIDDVIRQLCDSPCIKLGHNFVSFDRWWLEYRGFPVRGEIRDTMCINHALDPASLQSLEYLTSRYTWEPWYKDEGKGHDITLIKKDEQSYFHYCGMDSCVTKEIHDVLWEQLEHKNYVEFYRHHYEALYDPILDIMLRGVRIDHTYREKTLQTLLARARQARDRLGALAGRPLYTLSTQRDRAVYAALVEPVDQVRDTLARLELTYGKEQVEKSLQAIEEKTVSNTQLKELLYGTLGLPMQLRRRAGGEESASADGVALRTLRLQYSKDDNVTTILDLAADHNKAQKLASFLYPNTFDTDGRFRFTLKLNTEAARLASSKAPNGLGRNSQNTSRDDPTGKWPSIRRTVLPEPGHVIFEADASQIEGRIVFVRTKDPELIKLGRARIDFDQHSYVASLVFGKPIEQVGKGTEERQMAKSVNHACFDWTTEVLTQDGFKKIIYLTEWDTVAQFDGHTKAITFCKPLEYHKYLYKGDLLRFRQGYLAQLVTPNHRMLYETNGNWKVTEAAKVPNRGKIALNGYYSGSINVDENVVRICAAFQADGTLCDGGSMRWKFKKVEKIQRLRMLLEKCAYQYNVVERDGCTIIQVRQEASKDVLFWMPTKQFSSRLLQWSGESLDVLIDELRYWDGHLNGGSTVYNTADPQNVEWVQIFAHLRGLKASVSKREAGEQAYSDKGYWQISISATQTSHAGSPDKYAYDGHVYCLSVPTGFLVIRRNGCVSITGNSMRDMQGKTMADRLMKDGALHLDGTPYLAEECDLLLEAYHKAFPGIRLWQQSIRRELRAKKYLVNSWGRIWDVRYEEMNDDLFRRAYNFLPQSECAELTNIGTFVPMWRWLRHQQMQTVIMMQEHDALVCSCPPHEVYDVAIFLKTHLEVEHVYDGVALSVPAEFSMGSNYGEKKEFKELPDRATLEAMAREMVA